MTLDEAIERYTSNAEYERTHGSLQGCLEFRQLAEWLKDYKRLLEYDDTLYHKEHGEVIVDKDVWEDAKKALTAIEDIKAEIKDEACRGMNDRYCEGLWRAVKLIDKHISRKELKQELK